MTARDTNLLEALHAILTESVVDKPAAAWRILTRADDADLLAVALDFALDHELINADLVPLLRGDDVTAPGRVWTNPIDETELIWIPPGQFHAGRADQIVSSQGYFLAKSPVTNRQFQAFLTATSYKPTAKESQRESFLAHWQEGQVPPGQADAPVVWVSFVDALAYCDWAQLTLPTEWLWEKAARGAAGIDYPWREGPPVLQQWEMLDGEGVFVRNQHLAEVSAYADFSTAFGGDHFASPICEWCWPGEELTAWSNLPQTMPRLDRLRPELQADLQAALRGLSLKRRVPIRTAITHRRQTSIHRRLDWIGFRPAFYPLAHRE